MCLKNVSHPIEFIRVSSTRRALGLAFLLFLCRTENFINQWALENVLIEICPVFIIYYSGAGTR